MGRRLENVLCLFTRVLGGKTFSAQAARALEAIPGLVPRFVYLEDDDYGRHARDIPWLNRVSRLFVGPEILRHKLRRDPPPPYDAVMVQSFELLLACRGIDPRIPVILAHDATNVLSYRLIRDQDPGLAAALACRFKELAITPFYRAVLERVQAFLPRTRWCAESLVRDFGVDRRRIAVIPAGLDVRSWAPPPGGRPAHPEGGPTLLFVGNDFARKGGPFLLDLFRRRLFPGARLRILSNDPALRGIDLPGVEVTAGLGAGDRGRILEAYRAADIFVFPTRKEHMGLALVEAAAAGLPLVATDVGGVGEVVRDGENGRLMPRNAGEEAWAAALLDLMRDGEKRLRYGGRSRELAESEFSQDALRGRLEWALATAATGWPGRW